MLKSDNIYINVLPLNAVLDEKEFYFFKNKPDKEGFVGIFDRDLKQKGVSPPYIYTNFEIIEKADFKKRINLDTNTHAAKHFLKYNLFQYFKAKKVKINSNFVQDVELFYHLKDKNEANIAYFQFDNFVIRPSIRQFTDGFELIVMYKGKKMVWKKPVSDYQGNPDHIKKVMYDGQMYKYHPFLKENPEADRSKLYPILSYEMQDFLGVPRKGWNRENKIKKHQQKIESFLRNELLSEDFKRQFLPNETGFVKIDSNKVQQLPSYYANLKFGQGKVEKDPYLGLIKYGPNRTPANPRVVIFIIVAESKSESTGQKLYDALKGKYKGFKGINDFVGIPITVDEKFMIFKDENNPFPEIAYKLKMYKFDASKQYAAIYISPISKAEKDPLKQKVYYKVKEELFKYRATSQVIEEYTIKKDDMRYSMPNIATALLAKTDGIPWTLEDQRNEELIIGIGAFKDIKREKTYMGSTFCFSNNGKFNGFIAFSAEEMYILGGQFQDAIQKYREEHSNIKRVVLHFYKSLNNEESIVLQKALDELKLNIPIVIVTLHKRGAKDLVLTDQSHPEMLPKSGLYYKVNKGHYLLCNNTRYDLPEENIKSFPFPLNLRIKVISKNEVDEAKFMNNDEAIEILISQVYQFSRLNWRGVSIVSELPVSIEYPSILAEKYPHFEGKLNQDFTKKNFWFL